MCQLPKHIVSFVIVAVSELKMRINVGGGDARLRFPKSGEVKRSFYLRKLAKLC
jgi:hypothetical protein